MPPPPEPGPVPRRKDDPARPLAAVGGRKLDKSLSHHGFILALQENEDAMRFMKNLTNPDFASARTAP